MPLKDTDLKRYQFVLPGLKKREQMAEILRTIEQTCKIVQDRAAAGLPHEQWTSTTFTPPIKLSMPDGVVEFVKPNEESDTIASFSYNTTTMVWKNAKPEVLFNLAQHGTPSIFIDIKQGKHTVELRLDIHRGVYSSLISVTPLTGVTPAKRVELLQSWLQALGIPVALSLTATPGKVKAVHQLGLPAAVAKIKKGDDYVEIECGLSRELFANVFRKSLALAKGKISAWIVNITKDIPSELAKKLNKAGFPSGKQIDATYFWRLRSYKDFAALVEMAQRNTEGYGEVAASLLEFEFGKRLRGQLDVVATKKGGFKVWLSFDAEKAAAEFTALTQIKLKDYTW